MHTPLLRYCCYTLVCLFLSLSFLSCDLVSTEKCGPGFDTEDQGRNTSFAAWETFVDGGMRFYRRSLKVDNVCPDEHVTGRFEVKLKSGMDFTLPITATIRLEFGDPGLALLYGPQTDEDDTTENSFLLLGASTELGLSQAYGDAPGSYYVVALISFPTTGNSAQDLNYIINSLNDFGTAWTIRSHYFEYPE